MIPTSPRIDLQIPAQEHYTNPPSVLTPPALPDLITPAPPLVVQDVSPAPVQQEPSVQQLPTVQPVVPGQVQHPPVNSVNSPENSVYSQENTEEGGDSTTQEKKVMGFRVPMDVAQSIERKVAELTQVNPKITVHSYGVELLTNHESLHTALRERDEYRQKYEQAVAQINSFNQRYELDQKRIEDLATQVRHSNDYVQGNQYVRTEPVIPLSPQAWPTDTNQHVIEQLRRLQSDNQAMQYNLQGYQTYAKQTQGFLAQLGRALNDLFYEASALSWYTPYHFKSYLEERMESYTGVTTSTPDQSTR
jgi:hypothetical protein